MGSTSAFATALRFIDIGSNLGDSVFRGTYHGKKAHDDDFGDILERSRLAGLKAQLLTGGSLSGSKEVLELANQHDAFYCTVGCHPCTATEPSKHPGGIDGYVDDLDEVITADLKGKRRVRAVGECGLDYDRLNYCDKETQLKHFPPQLHLASKHNLPLFLHSRTSEAHIDLVRILREHEAKAPLPRRGVVHSFTGTVNEMNELVEMGYAIGVNGCSLKTAENLEVVKTIPLDSIMLETDCPYCDIRPSHASHALLADLPAPSPFSPPSVKKERHQPGDGKVVKSRNEPCTIGQVAWVVAKVKGVPAEEVAEAAYRNTVKMFDLALE